MTEKNFILLAMHGMPPNDFPRADFVEWEKLRSALDHLEGEDRDRARERYEELDRKMRSWPRTPQNDLFHKTSYDMASRLKSKTGCSVIVAFNDFCNPSLEQGFEVAVREGAKHVVVLTPMMTRGGSHSEKDIPEAIESARKKFPGLDVKYVWPFDDAKIMGFLLDQLSPYLNNPK